MPSTHNIFSTTQGHFFYPTYVFPTTHDTTYFDHPPCFSFNHPFDTFFRPPFSDLTSPKYFGANGCLPYKQFSVTFLRDPILREFSVCALVCAYVCVCVCVCVYVCLRARVCVCVDDDLTAEGSGVQGSLVHEIFASITPPRPLASVRRSSAGLSVP